jgi:hypothetical protein
MRLAYKGFYRIFNRSAPFRVPTDAGDFSLLDRRVVDHLLQFPERDLFLRALRAYVGGKQIGVDYVRPERMFGRSTNNLAISIVGAYVGAVLEETKRRPRFLRDRIVRSGRVVESASDGHDHAGPSGSSRPYRRQSRAALPTPRSGSADDLELASVRSRDARDLPGP